MPAKGSKKTHIQPVKFNAFFDEFEKIVTAEQQITDRDGKRVQVMNTRAVALTDIELIEATNERLEPNQRITRQTFENWKKAWTDGTLDPDIAERFFCVYQKAVRTIKESLFNAIVFDANGWQRFAWIMERKFSETWGKKDNNDDGDKLPQPIKIIKTYEKQIKGKQTD
jgi:hypothetical protein